MSERSTFWLSHLSAIEAEGITTKAYAEREGLSPQALTNGVSAWWPVVAAAAPSLADSFRSRSSLRCRPARAAR